MADVFARSLGAVLFFSVCVDIFPMYKCQALLTFNRLTVNRYCWTTRYTSNSMVLFFKSLFAPTITTTPWKALNHRARASQPIPGERALQRRRRKWRKQGGLKARLKAPASRPPLPSLLLATVQLKETSYKPGLQLSSKWESAAALMVRRMTASVCWSVGALCLSLFCFSIQFFAAVHNVPISEKSS